MGNVGRHWWKDTSSIFSSRILTGWQVGVRAALLQAGGVFLINVIILMYTVIKAKGGIVYEGDCNTVGDLTIGIHLIINILSTLLLGASNYVMQSLCAPTRSEVIKAHERKSWLDIGLQSMRNLGYTSRWKKFTWILLSASSIPLHLFYNSSFFSTVGANVYTPYLAQGPDIQDIAQSNAMFNWSCNPNDLPTDISSDSSSQMPCPDVNARWELLNASDCIQAYAVDFLSSRGDLIAVINSSTSNPGIVIKGAALPSGIELELLGSVSSSPYDWICSGLAENPSSQVLCEESWKTIDSANWILDPLTFDYHANIIETPDDDFIHVLYCLSETLPPSRCQLQFNLPLLIIVIIFNAGKVACIAVVATRMKDHPLVTVGDAIASFVKDPDPQTKYMCLVTQQHWEDYSKSQQLNTGPPTIQSTIQYSRQRIRWMSAASRQHWVVVVSLFFGAISIVLGLLGYAISSLDTLYGITGFSSLWQLGIGKASTDTIIYGWAVPVSGTGGLIASVLVSNSPQLILSIIYVVFNSLCTKLCLALEWSSYSHSRKPLRVSYPQGDQQSTYFLQIPYRFSLPLLIYAALLHWLVSQSIFLVAVTYWDANIFYGQLFTCGFSPIGMMLTSIVGASLILGALVLGYFKHLDSGMPLAGSCSAAISAACHPPENGSDPLKPLQWGVVSDNTYRRNQDEVVEHISFSSADVAEPVNGFYYS